MRILGPAADAALLKGSMDFIALNYYTSNVVRYAAGLGPIEVEMVPPLADGRGSDWALADGRGSVVQPERARTTMGWPIVPEGLHRLLLWLNERYPELPIYITENGAAQDDEPDDAGFVNDVDRIAYLRDHIAAAGAALAEGVDLRGYFVWSLLDNPEWSDGFVKRFGPAHCNRNTLQGTIKVRGHWYAKFIANGGPNGTYVSGARVRRLLP